MARLYKTNGEVVPIYPKSGVSFSLKELQNFVGGYIQMILLADGNCMFMDEESKLKTPPPPYNQKATALAVMAGIAPGDYILGDVVVCTPKEAGD